MHDTTPTEKRNDLKGRSGLRRIVNACIYSRDGYLAAWRDEQAFRQIIYGCCIAVPAALWLGQTWADRVLLIVPLVLSVLVELLNSAVENTVDRISAERHPLSKKAKDMGSAAQLTAQICIAAVWGSYLIGRFC